VFRVIAALDDATETLNQVFAEAFDGFTFGEECGDKCIDWSLTYSQVGCRYYFNAECGLHAAVIAHGVLCC
jgi:hypothetical protein